MRPERIGMLASCTGVEPALMEIGPGHCAACHLDYARDVETSQIGS